MMITLLCHKIRLAVVGPLYLYLCAFTIPFMAVFRKRDTNSFLSMSTMMLIKALFVRTITLHYDPEVVNHSRTIMVSNHINLLDGFVTWFSLTSLKKRNLIYNSKKSLILYGTLMKKVNKSTNFVFLERNLSYDYITLVHACKKMKALEEFTTVIFPEGTLRTHKRVTEVNIRRSKERNYPTPKNVIMPKTKGFQILVKRLADDLDGVIDCTIKYSRPLTLKNFILGRRCDVDVYVDYHPVPDIEGCETWLIDLFMKKDKRLEQGQYYLDNKYLTVVLRIPNKVKYVLSMIVPWLGTKLYDHM